MAYLKAIPIPHKPFIQWHGWVDTEAQFEALDEDTKKLVVHESDVPAYQFGVCPLKIEGGELVERTEIDMEGYELEFNAKQEQQAYEAKAAVLEAATFNYDSRAWPMHTLARARYLALQHGVAGDKTVMSTTGIVTIPEADIAALLTEYYKALLSITQP